MSKFKDLNQAFENADKVEELVYSRRKLRELPTEIGQLTGLKSLNLAYNKLKTLPESLSNLHQLHNLELGTNLLKEIPPVVYELLALKFLDLRSNQIKSLSAGINRLQALQWLNLRANPLKTLAPEIAELPHLRTISLVNCPQIDWEALGEILANIRQHFTLHINNCQLKKLPANFAHIPYLHKLDLSNNPDLDLNDALDKLANLPRLQNLQIVHTQRTLPENIARLTQLKSLSFDKFSDNEPSLLALENLQTLEALNNRWHKIPHWVWSLSNLETLDLRYNKIEQIPYAIEKLKKLKNLDLGYNNFHHFPIGLAGVFSQLERLNLEGNRAIDHVAIARFLRQLRQSGLGQDLQKNAAQLFVGKTKEAEQNLDFQQLIQLLNGQIPQVVEYVLSILETKIPKQDWQNELQGKTLYYYGLPTRFRKSEMQAFFKAHHIKVSQELTEKVDYWVLCAHPPKTPITTHLPERLQYISETHLFNCLIYSQLSSQYQVPEINHILQLLESSDTKNGLIALQMLHHRGLDEKFYADVLALALFAPDAKLQKEAYKLFVRYFPMHLRALVQSIRKTGAERKLKTLLESDLIDRSYFVNKVYKVAGLAKEYIIQIGGEFFEQVIRSQINYSEIVSLRYNLPTISTQIAELDFVKRIEFIGDNRKKNAFTHLPEVIYQMKHLEYLRIDEYPIEELSPQVGELPLLYKLRVTESNLEILPDTVTQLQKLEILCVFNNKIKALPHNIGALVNLQELWAFGNQLHELPESIGALTQLRHLHLSSNHIKKIPASIGNLYNLQELSLTGNPIESLPDEIAQLRNLKRLELSHHPQFNTQMRNQLQTMLPQCIIQFYR
ncbi:MAG: leucine-rich repeat domain-containing protein [Microscillaceae bacterium]|jgi:Leucine-rich repeat (LRR) protein|nr:leucine-rich repeat domain-containing protein [Microscillaceae bacterium]